MNVNRFLIVIDGSYFSYYCLFSAVKDWMEKYPEETSTAIKPAEECDQKNLPNLLNYDNFRYCLKKNTARRLENVDYIARTNFQDQLDAADGVDILFAMDDSLRGSFRYGMYPEYKKQRRLVKRSYQVQPIKDYVTDVVFKELEVEDRYGYRLVKVEGAEGDDVIATAFTSIGGRYAGSMLIASDHDFLQLEGVREFDLFGREAKRDLGGEEVSPQDYLVGKILMGDKSDNIKQVFYKCGPKTALKWTKDKDALRQRLAADHEAASRYLLNQKMISFKNIPKPLSEKIQTKLNESLYRNDVLNSEISLGDFMTL